MMSRFQRALRAVRHMFEPYKPLKRPTFLTDPELEIRRAVARDLLGETQVKPVLGRPLDYDRSPPPV
jgi:hypothetical protein